MNHTSRSSLFEISLTAAVSSSTWWTHHVPSVRLEFGHQQNSETAKHSKCHPPPKKKHVPKITSGMPIKSVLNVFWFERQEQVQEEGQESADAIRCPWAFRYGLKLWREGHLTATWITSFRLFGRICLSNLRCVLRSEEEWDSTWTFAGLKGRSKAVFFSVWNHWIFKTCFVSTMEGSKIGVVRLLHAMPFIYTNNLQLNTFNDWTCLDNFLTFLLSCWQASSWQ